MKFTRFQIAAAKRTAKSIAKSVAKLTKVNEKIVALGEERQHLIDEIEMWEAPIRATCNGMSSAEVIASLNEEETVETAFPAESEDVQPAEEIEGTNAAQPEL